MERSAEKTIKKFLPSLNVAGRKIPLKNLPLLFRGLYELQVLDINKRPFLLIQVKSKALGPKDFKKHSKRLKEIYDYPQIWFLKELHPHKVRRMIENELNFIVENKQVHLPAVNVSIKAETEKVAVIKKLSGLSINLLIREILKGDLSGKSKVEIAAIFNATKMTIGRAIEPLLTHDLCSENKVGVAKHIQFKPRAELWMHLQKNTTSPVKEFVFFDYIPKGLVYSGISALSKKTMLADDSIPSFAISKKDFSKKFKNTRHVLEDDAKARIELWDRSTTLVEQSCINAVDTFLILKNTKEERVHIELETLLKKYDLGVNDSWSEA